MSSARLPSPLRRVLRALERRLFTVLLTYGMGRAVLKLCLLVTSVEELPAGAEIVEATGESVGRVGSSAPVEGGLRVALGYLIRERAVPGTELRLREPAGGRVTVCGAWLRESQAS